jgi:hypothetical protein
MNKNILKIGAVALVLVAALAFYFFNRNKNSDTKNVNENAINTTSFEDKIQDEMGQPVTDLDKPKSNNVTVNDNLSTDEEQKVFSFILTDLKDCLDIKGSQPPEQVPVKVENVQNVLQAELGNSNTFDRWMNWHLKTPEGLERRLRIEVLDNENGKMSKEMHWYAVDREGLPIPLEIDNNKRYNPTDDVINEMLKQGTVTFKEKSAVALFKGGDRFEYIERNSELTELEILKGDRFFRCSNLKNRESCQCVR